MVKGQGSAAWVASLHVKSAAEKEVCVLEIVCVSSLV